MIKLVLFFLVSSFLTREENYFIQNQFALSILTFKVALCSSK